MDGQALRSRERDLALARQHLGGALGGTEGPLRLDPDPESWVRAALAKVGLKEAELNHEIALAPAATPPGSRRPISGRATAIVYDLTLVTADDRLIRAQRCKILANR